MAYNWDLIERLLLKVQESAGKNFAPRAYAEELAQEHSAAGLPVGNLDAMKQDAADYEAVLFNGGFIEPRPEDRGGTGENFVLTERGLRLLRLIGGTTESSAEARRRLDEKDTAALVPEIFDDLANGMGAV
ncbi:transcriptional regulator [Pseudomonas indica]|uniref:transcriptional regulator n=1 Tax=Pseudomonas indica TaxID=137658 RepID=UPI000BAC05BD|nr:transcriptional regulator [Pseudomonas indica]PAU52863.1 transcriptional regulator [Pseudomonas indica]